MTWFVELGLLSLLLGPPAPAVGPEIGPAATIGLALGPAIAEHDHAPLAEAFTRALPRACPATQPCTDEHACVADQPRIGVLVDGESRNYTLRWRLEDPRLDPPMTLRSTCELCSLVELEQQLASDLRQLCAQLDALDGGPGRLELSSDPSGARLRIDGRRVGATPWTGELAAGEHTIELWALGFRPRRESVAIRANVTGVEHLRLVATGSFARRRPSWPGWTSLGLGVALTVAGTALIAVDGQPWTGRCSGTDVDVRGNCRFVLATRSVGIGLAALGVGGLASGVGLVVWAQRDSAHTYAGVRVGGRF